jgi:hypothetical protein
LDFVEAVAVAVAVAVAPDPLTDAVEAAGLGVAVVQWGLGKGPAVLAAVPDGLALLLGLEVAVPLGLGLGLGVAVPLGLGLGLEVAVPLGLGLGLPLSEELAPGLAAPLLSPPLDDADGLVVTVVCVGELALPDEPDAAGVADACAEAGGQAVAWTLGAT